MPIYEYQCPHCGRVFEEWVKVSEAHGMEACPDCGTESPRLISHTSFVLKGGGWYVTEYGYRKGVKEDGAGGETKEAATKSGSGETKADQKTTKDTKPITPPTATAKPARRPAQAAS